MKRRERRLLIASSIIFIVIACLLGGQRLVLWQKNLDRRERNVELQEMEAEALLADAALWETRANWLRDTQPTAGNELEANRELDLLVGKARDQGLVVQSQQLQEPLNNEWFYQVGVSITVKGSLPAVFRWMHGVLSPAEFRMVPSLKITPDKDDPNQVIAAVQFWRRYSPTLTTAP